MSAEFKAAVQKAVAARKAAMRAFDSESPFAQVYLILYAMALAEAYGQERAASDQAREPGEFLRTVCAADTRLDETSLVLEGARKDYTRTASDVIRSGQEVQDAKNSSAVHGVVDVYATALRDNFAANKAKDSAVKKIEFNSRLKFLLNDPRLYSGNSLVDAVRDARYKANYIRSCASYKADHAISCATNLGADSDAQALASAVATAVVSSCHEYERAAEIEANCEVTLESIQAAEAAKLAASSAMRESKRATRLEAELEAVRKRNTELEAALKAEQLKVHEAERARREAMREAELARREAELARREADGSASRDADIFRAGILDLVNVYKAYGQLYEP